MSSQSSISRILFITHESWPTFRADVRVLFGKSLPRLGLLTDLVAKQAGPASVEWPGGEALLAAPGSGRFGVLKHQLKCLLTASPARYQGIQVRDLPLFAVAALGVARLKGMRFFYWMSFPMPEAQIARATRGDRPFRAYFAIQWVVGQIARFALYRIVLPRADRVFVQSERMVDDVAARGISRNLLVPVPMGVDFDSADMEQVMPKDVPRLVGKRVIVYLGTQDPPRRVDLLLDMMSEISKVRDDLMLVLVGDTADEQHRQWLRRRAEELDVAKSVIFTGWLPMDEAWQYVRQADVGLSPFPRGPLLDSCSPTKAIEYLALGVPVVVNDQPDQERLVRESGGGVCATLAASCFAKAVIDLLALPTEARNEMGMRGRKYVKTFRDYNVLAANLRRDYRDACREPSSSQNHNSA